MYQNTKKVYFAIFVYLNIKTIHIEIVKSLSTEVFLAALRRFIARRGRPNIICSDNGKKNQRTVDEIHALYKMLQSTSQMATVQDCFACERCEWKFIPPH